MFFATSTVKQQIKEKKHKKLPASDGQKCTNGFFRQLHTKLSLVTIAGYHIEAFLIGNSCHCVIWIGRSDERALHLMQIRFQLTEILSIIQGWQRLQIVGTFRRCWRHQSFRFRYHFGQGAPSFTSSSSFSIRICFTFRTDIWCIVDYVGSAGPIFSSSTLKRIAK